MKNLYSVPGLGNRIAPRFQDKLPKLDFAKRHRNRQLPIGEVIKLLRAEAPLLLRMTQIVGQWLWIQFPERQPRTITSLLAQIGFHWNYRRQLWQHPCGVFCDRSAHYDPRKHYATRNAA
jgi:hypothetical protein